MIVHYTIKSIIVQDNFAERGDACSFVEHWSLLPKLKTSTLLLLPDLKGTSYASLHLRLIEGSLEKAPLTIVAGTVVESLNRLTLIMQ